LVVVSTVATPGEWQCKIRTGGVRRLAVANGPNIFQMLLVRQFNMVVMGGQQRNSRGTMYQIVVQIPTCKGNFWDGMCQPICTMSDITLLKTITYEITNLFHSRHIIIIDNVIRGLYL